MDNKGLHALLMIPSGISIGCGAGVSCVSRNWPSGSPPARCKVSIQHSLISACSEGPDQIGYARVVSESLHLRLSHRCVFVCRASGGRVWAKWRSAACSSHPSCRGFALGRWPPRMPKPSTPVYGFNAFDDSGMMLQKFDTDAYKPAPAACRK